MKSWGAGRRRRGPSLKSVRSKPDRFTAKTVTDEQIRELRETAMNGSPLAESCDIALGDLVLDGSDADVEQEVARARCAELLAARAAKEGK